MSEELSEKEILEKEVTELDAFCAELWSEDPEVEIVEVHIADENAPHGVNEEGEMDLANSKSD